VSIPHGRLARTVLIALVLTAGAGSSEALAGAPPSSLWSAGYNLCKAVPLGALRKAGGQPYAAGKFDGHVCNWERGDLKAGVTLSTQKGTPGSFNPFFVRTLGLNGKNGFKVKTVQISGASKAILESLPAVVGGSVSRRLIAEFAPGVITISMTNPGALPDATVLAVMRLATG
jgi:hypothetical protein